MAKVTRENKGFQDVIIRLESIKELMVLVAALGHMNNKSYGDSIRELRWGGIIQEDIHPAGTEIFEELSNILEEET